MNPRYVANRLGQTVIVMLFVSLLTFSFLHVIPGDPITMMISPETASSVTPDDLERLREFHGLNRPFPLQYLTWLGGLVTGDWGQSIRTGEPVLKALSDRLPVTLILAVLAMAISLTISIPMGIIAGARRNSLIDRGATVFAVAGVAMPNFWLAILLIGVFAVQLRWLPPSGYVAPQDDFVQWARHIALPAAMAGTAQTASITRQMRSSVLEVLRQDYVRTARAKGLAERIVISRHVLRNALIPVVTILGFQVGFLISGTVIIEQMFAIPGMGQLAVRAIFTHDYPIVMGFVLMIALTVQLANLATDLSYGMIDPRIQLGRGQE